MRKSTKLKIFRRKKRSVILSVLKRHSLRQHTTLRIRCHELLGERVKQVLINGRKQTFERILKSKAAKVFGTAGAAPDSDVAELVVEHPLSECLHVDFVME